MSTTTADRSPPVQIVLLLNDERSSILAETLFKNQVILVEERLWTLERGENAPFQAQIIETFSKFNPMNSEDLDYYWWSTLYGLAEKSQENCHV